MKKIFTTFIENIEENWKLSGVVDGDIFICKGYECEDISELEQKQYFINNCDIEENEVTIDENMLGRNITIRQRNYKSYGNAGVDADMCNLTHPQEGRYHNEPLEYIFYFLYW